MDSIWENAGAVASIVGMLLAFWQAHKAKASRQSAEAAVKDAHAIVKQVQLAAILERLKNAQDHIREISPDRKAPRGFNYSLKIDAIRKEFDTALSSLPQQGSGEVARSNLKTAQFRLNQYSASLTNEPAAMEWQKLQNSVQDAISTLTTEASQLGGPK